MSITRPYQALFVVALTIAVVAIAPTAHASPLCSTDDTGGGAEDGAESGDRFEDYVDDQIDQSYSIGLEDASIQIEDEAKTFLRSMGERFTVLAPYVNDVVWVGSLAVAIRNDILHHHIVFRKHDGTIEIAFFDGTQSEVLTTFAQLMGGDLGTELGAMIGEILLPGIGGFIGGFIGGIAGWELGGAFEHWLAKKFDPPAIPNLTFSASGPIAGLHCTALHEFADAPWNDNYLCSDVNLGIEFRSGRLGVTTKDCANMFEPNELAYWNDDYLCWADLGYSLIWSPSGEPTGATEKHCARIVDAAEATYWRDDYVCVYRTEDPAPTVKVSDSPLGPIAPATQLANLAFGRLATQSSTVNDGSASRAVDGITDGDWGNSSVTHTDDVASPWWQVDLAGTEAITEVLVYNRTDCCADRLSNFDVELLDTEGNVVASQHFAGVAPALTTVRFLAVPAQFVRVQLVGTNPLSLAEVVVHGNPIDAQESNLAWGKPAIQSTTDVGDAGRATDGVIGGVFADASVTQTTSQAKPWWQVDLLGMYDITEVTLYNRTDCCGNRLANFHVDLIDEAGELVARRTNVPAVGASLTLSFASKRARFVRVQLAGTGILSLAEVVVRSNLAIAQAASQSSVAAGAVAMRAIDGNVSGLVADASLAQTNVDPHPYWQVDLQAAHDVSQIALWGSESNPTTLSDVFVQIRDARGSVVRERSLASFQRSARIDVRGARGRYVRIERRGQGALTLAEVQVFDGARPEVQELVGRYQRLPVENDWHDGFITYDASNVRWENAAGEGWSLSPMLGIGRLFTDTDCPYYASPDDSGRSFDLVTSSAGRVTSFFFQHELYTRTLSAEDVVGRYQRLPVGNTTHDGRIVLVNGVLRWKNKANSNWLLTQQFGQNRVMAPSGKPFNFQMDAGVVTGFRYNGELYVRIGG